MFFLSCFLFFLLVDSGLIGFEKGQTWYLIATRWYNQWEEFVGLSNRYGGGGSGPNPGPIDNHPIINPDGSLKGDVRERSDFVIRSEAIWNKLFALYGGGPAIPRKVVASFWSKSVETHLYKLQFLRSSDMDKIVIGHFR
jgi:hypothetical protein